ncbi:hypothetical protein FTUN_6512 [Frigoriglobus tundricola]|uniref:Uncharacterized protein n=1 Tax=Frigoriglobus tundricola TaxID=2774151 RepID=A0A6M5YXS7_9BACT|nr:hypothetical protein FTUN_6512 [Frigoriglobus tundricola]
MIGPGGTTGAHGGGRRDDPRSHFLLAWSAKGGGTYLLSLDA